MHQEWVGCGGEIPVVFQNKKSFRIRLETKNTKTMKVTGPALPQISTSLWPRSWEPLIEKYACMHRWVLPAKLGLRQSSVNGYRGIFSGAFLSSPSPSLCLCLVVSSEKIKRNVHLWKCTEFIFVWMFPGWNKQLWYLWRLTWVHWFQTQLITGAGVQPCHSSNETFMFFSFWQQFVKVSLPLF